MFLRLVSILTLEGLLQGYVKCKNTMRGNVNFLTQNVKSETSLLEKMWKFILIEQPGFRSDILCQKVDITRHCVFPVNIALKKTFQL